MAQEVIIKNNRNIPVDITDKNEIKVFVNGVDANSGMATETSVSTIKDNTASLLANTNLLKTPNMIRPTTSGTIPGTPFSCSFSNVGSANATVLGATLKPGETVNFSAGGENNRFNIGTLTYNATGTELLIIYIN